MAGIGFKLRTLFQKDSYFDTLRGIIYSTAIAGGPIFFSILCLIMLGIFSTTFLALPDVKIFLVTIVYVFAFSLISTGFSQLLITRYLSDLIYKNRPYQILPTFTTVLVMTMIFQFVIGLPFILLWQTSLVYKTSALMLFITVGCIWQLMIFLSALRNYKIVLFAFLTGLIISVIFALVLGKKFGLPGFLHGYTIGHVVLLMILVARVFIEFDSHEKPNFNIFAYFKEMPLLIVIGLLYNAGIWADKMIFWFSPKGEQIDAFLYAFTDYDGAAFISYLTIIPSYTYFLVKVETDFYGHFRKFYEILLHKGSLTQINNHKTNITKSVKESFVGLIKLQGTVTLVCLLFSSEIATFFKLPVLSALILDKALLAVFLQMMLLTVMIFLMYFDIKLQLLIVALVFFLSNTLFTYITFKLGYVFYGYGYLFSCLLALITGFICLNKHLNELEYRTFTGQPLIN